MVGGAITRFLKNNSYENLLLPNRKDLDLLNNVEVENWFYENKPEVVILAAAKVGGIEANNNYPADFILENIKIQTNIIENSWKRGVKKFLFLGSSCIYPKLAPQPLKEEYLLTGKLEPTNEPYAIAKIAGIKLCSALKKQYGFDAISLMPTNLYGPGDNYNLSNSHVMPALIRKFYDAKLNKKPEVICWGSGAPKREFLYVDDLAEATIFILENISSEKNPDNNFSLNLDSLINIGTGLDISIKDLAEMIAKELNYKGNIKWETSKPDGTPRKLLDVSQIKKLGWQAKTSLEKGIKLTIDNYFLRGRAN
jgi:GDP-L-fucose synthase